MIVDRRCEMNIPEFTAQASLYRTSNSYRCSGSEFSGSIPAQSVIAAYIPGPQTQHDCSVCTDACAVPRNICLAKVAISVTEQCIGSLGFGCGAAIALGYIQTGSCYAGYEACLGYCNIPDLGVEGFHGPCCPKICGWPNPLKGSRTGCCDHGEACVDQDDPNSRQGCCPSGQDVCAGKCCPIGEVCCPGDRCCKPPSFSNDPPPPPPVNNCIFGGDPCGTKCCPIGTMCCGVFNGQPDCKPGSNFNNACLR